MALDKKISELPALVGSPSLTDLIAIVNLGITKKATLSQLLAGIGAVSGTGTINRIPVWTSTTAQGNSYFLQDGNGVILDSGKKFDTEATGGTDILDIGTVNADEINLGHFIGGYLQLHHADYSLFGWENAGQTQVGSTNIDTNGWVTGWADTVAGINAGLNLENANSKLSWTDGTIANNLTLESAKAQLYWTDNVTESVVLLDSTVAQLLWQDNINGGNAYCTVRGSGAFLQWSDTTATLFATIDLTSQSSLIKYTDTAGGLISSLTLHGGVAQLDFTDGVVTSFIKQDTVGIEINTDGDFKIVDGTQGAGKVLTSDVNGVATWQTPSGGGGTPGGSDTQVQYNNAGAFGGITGATTNGTTLTLVAPILGTPASGTLTNTTGLPLTTGVTGVLPLANGGTNKNMTAVNGGIVWTDADSMEVSAAGSSGQILRSGGAAAPTWSTATFPATATPAGAYLRADGTNWITSTLILPNAATANQIVRATATDTYGGSTNLVYDGTFLGIGTTAPASMLEINGGGAAITQDGIRFRQPNVAHGMTGLVPTDVYGITYWLSATAGGFGFSGYSDSDSLALQFFGTVGNATTTISAIDFAGRKKNGTTVQSLAATEKLITFSNNTTIAATMLANGSLALGTTASPSAMLDVRGKAYVGVATTSDTLADTLIGVSATTQKGLVIQMKASPTANPFELQSSAGSLMAFLTKDGTLTLGGNSTVATILLASPTINSNALFQIGNNNDGTASAASFRANSSYTQVDLTSFANAFSTSGFRKANGAAIIADTLDDTFWPDLDLVTVGANPIGLWTNSVKRVTIDATNGSLELITGGLKFTTKGINTTAGDSATINSPTGRFRKDTSGTTFTLTNSFIIDANSIVVWSFASDAGIATQVTVVAGSGSAVFTFSAAPLANTDINFFVVN